MLYLKKTKIFLTVEWGKQYALVSIVGICIKIRWRMTDIFFEVPVLSCKLSRKIQNSILLLSITEAWHIGTPTLYQSYAFCKQLESYVKCK